MSDRIENTGTIGGGDGKAISELVEEIRAAIADRKVSSKVVRTSSLNY